MTSPADPAALPSPQALAVPNSKVKGRSAVYRNVLTFADLRKTHVPNPIRTAYEGFEIGCKLYPDNHCLGYRPYFNKDGKGAWGPYMWETYSQIRQRRDNFGSGLLNIYRTVVKGTKPSNFAVGILAINRKEWVITDLACQAYSLVSVALYDTLGPDATEYIINLTDIEILVASLDNIPKILAIKQKLPCLKAIISMDSLTNKHDLPGHNKYDVLNAWGKNAGVFITDFETVEARGKASPLPNIVPKPDDLFTINFTSGTTGNPKGVVLTHENAATAVCGVLAVLIPHSRQTETMLSFLPLAHIYERLNVLLGLLRGSGLGLYHGVITEIVDDIQHLKPTILAAVPRLLLRIEAAIRASTIDAPGFKGALSRKAYSAKLAQIDSGGTQYHWLWDRLWSRKIRQVLGGRLDTIFSGSAPLSKDTNKFLRAALACDVVEGWGMTESMASGTLGHVKDPVLGHVGPPIPHCEVVLQDVPEMNYTSEDKPYPRGELLLRGGMRFQEYYKEKGKTKETIDEEGWLHTGDVAMIDGEGRVYIIDRVKNIFKLSQGEYVAAERLEAFYSSCPLVAQIFVYGDSLKSHLVAMVGVDPVNFAPFASKILNREVRPNDTTALEAACADKRVRLAILENLGRVATQKALAGFERIRNVHLSLEPFSLGNGTLTPSFKLKRASAVQLYKSVMDKLYEEAGSDVKPAKL